MGVRLAPSMMAMDFLNMREQLGVINARGGICHLDVMDGRFAPSMGITPDLARAIKSVCKNPMEAHLMVEDPEPWLEVFADIGVSEITLHIETVGNKVFRLISKIESLGCRAGIALCPATPISAIEYVLPSVSLVAVMTVDIGFSGGKFIPQMLGKIERVREIREKNDCSFEIQADGGCSRETFGLLRNAGVDRFVTGSALFLRGDATLDAAYDRLIRDIEDTTGELVL